MPSKHRRPLAACALCSLSLLALAACGPTQETDMHDAPRQTQPYESVDSAKLDLAGLKAHLRDIARAADEAVANEQWIELHHVEVALTPTIDAMRAKLGEPSPEAEQFLDTLSTVAVKLHEAGHDQNAAMAKTLNAKLQASVARMDLAIR